MIRVGIVFGFDEAWLGGVNYFRNLLNAVYEMPDRDIEIVILTGNDVTQDKLGGFPKVEIVRNRMFDRQSPLRRIRSLLKRVLGRDWLLERLLVRNHVDVLSHSGWLGDNSPIATIGWIPDFQSLRLPGFFTARELIAIKREFSRLARDCSRLIVSSHDALEDLQEFLPSAIDKSAVLRFAVPPVAETEKLPSLSELQSKYGFSGKFILLPNQFWAHKNHRVVIDSVAALKQAGLDILVLATGNTHDYRNPGFYAELEARIHYLDVATNFKVLGMIPYPELRSLMRYAEAIINPSLFEGWSTTVEEAKAFGKTVLLSDIAVHREQNPLHGIYFPPHDADRLAFALRRVWEQPEAYLTLGDAMSRHAAVESYAEFAQTYRDIVVSTHKAFCRGARR